MRKCKGGKIFEQEELKFNKRSYAKKVSSLNRSKDEVNRFIKVMLFNRDSGDLNKKEPVRSSEAMP